MPHTILLAGLAKIPVNRVTNIVNVGVVKHRPERRQHAP
jgi:hypothetical protein